MFQNPDKLLESQTTLDKLARDMAINMIDLATVDDDEFLDAIKYFLDDYKGIDKDRRVRNILIVGSGASSNANTKIPSAFKVVEDLYEQYVKTSELEAKKNLYNLKVAEKNPGTDAEKFENKLKTLDFLLWDKDIKQIFRTKLGYRHTPSLFYEIVGHMFKHRLIDVIINFNFDEILDTVISEEMGNGEYRKIVLNGDCPDNFQDLYLKDSCKLEAPIYIKPHGSVSHAGSIKYTYDHYSDGNATIKSLISNLLSNDRGGKAPFLDINIISAGYSYSDPDLHTLLNLPKSSGIKNLNYYIFDYKTEAEFFKKNAFLETLSPSPFYECTKAPDIGQSFKCIWLKATLNFKEKFHGKFPKGIERHEIIAGLFHKDDIPPLRSFDDPENPKGDKANQNLYIQYIKRRIYVEIAIVLAQSQGLVHINQFRGSRLKDYISLLHKFDPELIMEYSLDYFLLRFSFVSPYMQVMRDTYQISEKKLTSSTSKIPIDLLLNELARLIDIRQVTNDDYKKWFTKVANNNLCVVNSDIKEYYLTPFKTINRKNLLFSDLRWLYSLGKEFEATESDSWNVILVISETGDILNDDIYGGIMAQNKSVIWTILADHRIDRNGVDSSHKKTKNFPDLKLRIEYLPWEMHNKHMYIFLKISNTGDLQFKKGIYYVRRLLTNVVNPVVLEDGRDVETLFNYFCSYWQKAQSYSELKYDKLNLNEIDFKSINEQVKDQLKKDVKMKTKKLSKWVLKGVEAERRNLSKK